MEKSDQEEYEELDEVFFEEAKQALMDLGLPEDEAESEVNDYYNLY